MEKSNLHQIGAVVDATGLSIHTIRYYEKLGLIQKPKRSHGGFRLYSDGAIKEILFIKKSQSFGLKLEEIKKIMSCSDEGLNPCCDLITEVFTKKIEEFESKIQDLQQMKRRLKRLVSQWSKK
jgi:DNA-binding transcriptional MerR regulator